MRTMDELGVQKETVMDALYRLEKLLETVNMAELGEMGYDSAIESNLADAATALEKAQTRLKLAQRRYEFEMEMLKAASE